MSELARRQAVKNARREARDRYLRDDAGLDTLLRYEVQDRRRRVVRRIHERGYAPEDVLAELVKPLAALEALPLRDVDALLIEAAARGSHAIANTLASLHLAEHPELWPLLRRLLHRNSTARWRRKARAAAVRTWAPAIPGGTFGAGGSLWLDEPLEVAA